MSGWRRRCFIGPCGREAPTQSAHALRDLVESGRSRYVRLAAAIDARESDPGFISKNQSMRGGLKWG